MPPLVAETEDFPRSCFDKKYKTILDIADDELYNEVLEWLNKNTNGSVQVQDHRVIQVDKKYIPCSIGVYISFIGFENLDDALFFKIKFLK